MESETEKELRFLKREVKEVKDIVTKLDDLVSSLTSLIESINTIVRGHKDSDQPEGLIHSVYENTKFRKIIYAWLWLLTGAISTIGLQIFFNILAVI